jgi:COPII coat assembly protein SEC16
MTSPYLPPQRSFTEGFVAPPVPKANGVYSPYAPSHNRETSGASQSSVISPYIAPLPPVDQSQEVSLAAPTHAPYAPSPTLLGTNDPLGRVSGRAPIISMGFGGKFVACFHGAGTMSGGFDVALSSRQSTDVTIRSLHDIISASALDMGENSFPGPLFNDPGTPTAASLVRTGAAQTKAKKAKVIKYLEERADEISRGLGYLHGGSDKQQQMEAKLVIIQLLKVLVEQDGRLLGR